MDEVYRYITGMLIGISLSLAIVFTFKTEGIVNFLLGFGLTLLALQIVK